MGKQRKPSLEFETPLLERGELVVGIDEVGRGALAGPLVVGAVLLRASNPIPEGLTDSKLLSAVRRAALEEPIKEWCHSFGIGWASAREIDEWGMRTALAVAATRALNELSEKPTVALIDGNLNLLISPIQRESALEVPPLPYGSMPVSTLIKGDRKSGAIAGASVLAKVARDRFMRELSTRYPSYGWERNKGYGTESHMQAIREFGTCDQHRQSWKLPEVELT
jgi:ribonuclease HII